MKTKEEKGYKYRDILKNISTVISWTIFVLLLICAAFLIYYVIAMQLYVNGTGKDNKNHIAPKFSLYTIVSPSMVPNINVNDVVIDLRVDSPEEIKIGDVITFYASEIPEVHGGTITHRVIAIKRDNDGNYYYRTKGDNNLVEDGIDISYKNVVGKVALRIPKLGSIQRFLVYKSGWVLVILAIAVYILIKALLRFLKKSLAKFDQSTKLIAFLNKPLLEFHKPKLLTYNPPEESNTPESIEIEDNTPIFNDNQTPITNISNQTNNKPKKKKKKKKNQTNNPVIPPSFFDTNDDIEDDDLPSLK